MKFVYEYFRNNLKKNIRNNLNELYNPVSALIE